MRAKGGGMMAKCMMREKGQGIRKVMRNEGLRMRDVGLILRKEECGRRNEGYGMNEIGEMSCEG